MIFIRTKYFFCFLNHFFSSFFGFGDGLLAPEAPAEPALGLALGLALRLGLAVGLSAEISGLSAGLLGPSGLGYVCLMLQYCCYTIRSFWLSHESRTERQLGLALKLGLTVGLSAEITVGSSGL